MIFHENRLLADDSHEISFLFFDKNKVQMILMKKISYFSTKIRYEAEDSHEISYLIFVKN